MKKPEEKTQPQTNPEEKKAEEIQDEDLENVSGGALNLTGTIGIADLRSIRRLTDIRRIKKLP